MGHDRDYDPRFPDEEWNQKLLTPAESTVDDEEDDEDEEDDAPVPAPPQGLRTVNTPTRAPQRKVK